ncbi:MAG: hypothetical protein C4291_01750 [Candidatus Dadabacteria bacterium]
MSVRIDVWSDFVCPFCFLIVPGLEELQGNYDISICWRAFLLRPPGTPPISAQRQAMIEAERKHVKHLARTRYGLELNPGPIGINTLTAHIAVKYAEAHAKGNAFHSAVMKAFWQEARLIDDKEVLKGIASQVDLNGEDIATAWRDSTFASAVGTDINLASTYGIRSVPTLFFDERYLVIGAPAVSSA